MTTVPFNTIPGNLLVPFWYAEINSGGTPYDGLPRLLLLGQKTSAGTATAGTVIGPIQNDTEAALYFGVGSMLYWMFKRARTRAPFQPIWVMPLADPSGASAAGSVTFTAPGATGVAILDVWGAQVTWQVNAADSASNICVNAVAAINALNLPVIAAQDGTTAGKCNLTARHVGALGNGQQLLRDPDSSNVLAAANATIVAMAGGSGVPVLTTPLASLNDTEYDVIAGPYADATSLNAVRDFLSDQIGRWAPSQMLYGHYFSANYGNLAAQVSLGTGRNDQHVTIMASQVAPTPQWELAAIDAAVAAQHLGTAPEVSRPLQTLTLDGFVPPTDPATWWHPSDRQALYSSGMAAYKVRADGVAAIDRQCTTYQKNAAGVVDRTFLDTETMFQTMFVSRFLRTAVSNAHARQALADENPFNVAEITTPKDIRNTLIHAYEDLEAVGVVENSDIFARNLVVVRNALDANRVDAFIPIDVVNQLRVVAANVTAYLQTQSPSQVSVNP